MIIANKFRSMLCDRKLIYLLEKLARSFVALLILVKIQWPNRVLNLNNMELSECFFPGLLRLAIAFFVRTCSLALNKQKAALKLLRFKAIRHLIIFCVFGIWIYRILLVWRILTLDLCEILNEKYLRNTFGCICKFCFKNWLFKLNNLLQCWALILSKTFLVTLSSFLLLFLRIISLWNKFGCIYVLTRSKIVN
jgi:hypothetical protein